LGSFGEENGIFGFREENEIFGSGKNIMGGHKRREKIF
jgi:hypothetical protein